MHSVRHNRHGKLVRLTCRMRKSCFASHRVAVAEHDNEKPGRQASLHDLLPSRCLRGPLLKDPSVWSERKALIRLETRYQVWQPAVSMRRRVKTASKQQFNQDPAKPSFASFRLRGSWWNVWGRQASGPVQAGSGHTLRHRVLSETPCALNVRASPPQQLTEIRTSWAHSCRTWSRQNRAGVQRVETGFDVIGS